MKSELINIRPDARVKSNGCSGTLEREEWRPIKGYEGLYEVSSFGRVKNPRRNNKLMTLRPDKDGYPTVGLTNNRVMKTRKVHRLVMTAFVPNPDNLPVINHRNEVKTANYPDNMEWCTVKYNNNYGTALERSRINRTGLKRSKEVCTRFSEISIKYFEEHPEARERMSRQSKAYFEKHPEAREALSQSAKARFGTDEARKEISERWKRYYKEHPETKEKISNLQKRRFENPEERLKVKEAHRKDMIPIVQLDMSGNYIREWESARGASKILGIYQSGIQHNCRGRFKSYKGFIWKYKSDYENERNQ